MLTIQFPDLQRLFHDVQQQLKAEHEDILEQLGTRVLQFARQDYSTKSSGGTGTDGIAWKKLASSTIAAHKGRTEIGLQSGLQRASLGLTATSPEGVSIGYGRSYSPFFDEARPLLPDALPPSWLEALEKQFAEWGTKIVAEALG